MGCFKKNQNGFDNFPNHSDLYNMNFYMIRFPFHCLAYSYSTKLSFYDFNPPLAKLITFSLMIPIYFSYAIDKTGALQSILL